MLTIREQSVINYAPQRKEKSINYAYQDWFLTGTVPCHALTSFGQVPGIKQYGQLWDSSQACIWSFLIHIYRHNHKSQILAWNGKMTGTDSFTLFWEEMVY